MNTKEKRERQTGSMLHNRRITYVRGLIEDLVKFFENSENGEGDVVLRGLEALLAEAEAHQTSDSKESTSTRTARRKATKKTSRRLKKKAEEGSLAKIHIDGKKAWPLFRSKGLTASDLAQSTGLSVPSINNILSGKTRLDLNKKRHRLLHEALTIAAYPFEE